MRQKMVDMVHRIQDEICDALRQIDDIDYRQDEWTREEGGGGRSRVFSGGKVFEKAGVNVSVVHGTCLLYTSPSPRDATLSRMPSSA